MFEGAQTALNKYKGYPSPSIDAEWNRVIRRKWPLPPPPFHAPVLLYFLHKPHAE